MKASLRYLFANSSIHGLKYLASDKEPRWKIFFAQVFWICFIAISLFLMCWILFRCFNEYSPTSINLDTNYLDWNNTFPSVSICLTLGYSTNKIKEYLKY